MKKLLAGAAFAAMMVAAGGAYAADSIVGVTASSSSACSVSGAANAVLGDIAPGGTVNTGVKSLTFGTAGCNAPAKVSVVSANGGLAKAGSGCTGSASVDCIVYTLAASWNGAAPGMTTAGIAAATTGEVNSTSYGSSPITATLTPVNSGNVVNAGSYSETLTLTVLPQ